MGALFVGKAIEKPTVEGFFAHRMQQDVESRMRKILESMVELILRGISQADMAERVGLSESRMSRILNGRVETREYEIKAIRRVLGLETKDRAV